MTKVTRNQRFQRMVKRMQSPYTIQIPIKTEFDTTVIQLTGVYFTQRLEIGDDPNDEPIVVTIEERLDLGTHSNLALATKEAAAFRDDPEIYYAAYLRVQRDMEEAAQNAVEEQAAVA